MSEGTASGQPTGAPAGTRAAAGGCPRRPAFSGAVLTGGRSRRMGRDKALLPVGGRPLVARAADALRAAGAAEVLAIGGDAPALAALGLDARPDAHPGEGPLGAILTALAAAAHEVVVVLACDLPYARPEGVRAVLEALGPGDLAAVPVVDGRLEPLHAAYRRGAASALSRAFAAGERAPRRALRGLPVQALTLADPAWVASANRPEDLPPGSAPATLGGVSAPQPVPVPEVDVEELARQHAEGAWVLDVRQPDEYEEGHVPGAHLVPLDQLASRAGEVPLDRPVYVVCRSGARSAMATAALREGGWDATNVAGGTQAWAEAGHPVVRGTNPR